MGVYVNPPDRTKETWLKENGVVLPFVPTIWQRDFNPETHLPVVLVDNGAWTAALIVWCDSELKRVLEDQTGRPMIWYLVSLEKLIGVCPRLGHYLGDR